MKLQVNWAHAVAVLLSSVGLVLQFLQTNPSISAEMHITSNTLLFGGFLVALMSKEIFGTSTPPQVTIVSTTEAKPAGNGEHGFVRIELVALVAFAATAAALGCGLFGSGSKLPADLAADYNCVVGDIDRGVTGFVQIEADCLPGQAQTVIDIIESLLGSPQFAKEHVAQFQVLQGSLIQAKSDFAAGRLK